MEDDSIVYHIQEFLLDHNLSRGSYSSYIPGYRVIIVNPSFRGNFPMCDPDRFNAFMSHVDVFEEKLKSWGYQYHRNITISSYGKSPIERICFFIKATHENPIPTFGYIKYYIEKSLRWTFNISNIDYRTINIVSKYENSIKKDEINHLISNIFKDVEIKFVIQSRESGFDIRFDL